MFHESADKSKFIGTFTRWMWTHAGWYKMSFKNPFVLTTENVVLWLKSREQAKLHLLFSVCFSL